MADAGEFVGKGWLNWIVWELAWLDECPPWCGGLIAPFGPTDWIVVKVVVKDRTDGAGEEKVLSPPLRESRPPPAVRLVPVTDDAMCEGAWMEWLVSWSVDMVGAIDIPPAVGGAGSSADAPFEDWLLRANEGSDIRVLWAVMKDGSLWWAGAARVMRPDCGYGLLFLDGRFLEPFGIASRLK